MSNKLFSRILDVTLVGIFTSLMILCSYIHIPTPTVSFTLQTFCLYLCLFCLGTRRALACVGIYIAMGLIGLPVFSGFMGGVGTLFSASGGFILGFLPTILLASLFMGIFGHSLRGYILSGLLSLPLCYLIGSVFFATVYLGKTSPYEILYSALICVLPYIIPDILKIIASALLGVRLSKILKLDRRF